MGSYQIIFVMFRKCKIKGAHLLLQRGTIAFVRWQKGGFSASEG